MPPLNGSKFLTATIAMTATTPTPLSMHAARLALNHDDELRQWAEAWLKNKERASEAAMTDEEFAKHWLYVRPERMHEGALEAVAAYRNRGSSEIPS